MSVSCQETAAVTGIHPDGRAIVVIQRAEACHSCSAKGACQTLGGKTQDMTLVLENTLDVKPGDQVILSMAEASVIKASAVLYLIPAIGLVGGALLGWSQSTALGMGSDPASILGAAVGLVVGFVATKLVAGSMSKKPHYTPHLKSVQAVNVKSL